MIARAPIYASGLVQVVPGAGLATFSSPFTCRKAGQSPFLRELVIPFGRSGYVALFEIEDASNIVIVAVRHQLEDDYH